VKRAKRARRASARRHRQPQPGPTSEALQARLQALTDVLTTSLDIDRVLNELLTTCAQGAGCARGTAYLLEASGSFSLRARLGYPASAAGRLQDFFGCLEWLRRVVDAGEPVGVADGEQKTATAFDLLRKAKTKSLLVVPLVLGKDRMGAVVLASAKPDLPDKLELFSPSVRLQLGHAMALARAIHSSASSEQRFRDLVEGLDAIVWEADPGTLQFTFVSRRAEKILRYPIEQWLTETDFWINHIHPEDRAWAVAYCRKGVAEASDREFEYRMVAADGRTVWLRDIVHMVKDDDGRVQLLRGLMVDITERKRTERKLEERTAYLSALIENTPLAVVVLDADHRVQMCNPAFERLFLHRQSEMVGANLDELIAPRELATDAGAYTRQVLAGHAVHSTTRRRRKDGRLLEVEVHGVPLLVEGELVGVYALYRDITERRRAERLQAAVYRIAEQADRCATLAELYQAVHEIIQDVMPARNFYIALYDEKEDLLSFPHFVDEVDVPLPPQKPGRGLTAYVLRTGKSLLCTLGVHEALERAGEVELVGVQSPIWLGVPLRIGEKTIGVMAVQHYSDASAYGEREQHILEYVSSQVAKTIERKRAEEALRESEAKFRALTETTASAIMILRGDRFLYVNPAAEAILGYAREELEGRAFDDFIHPDFRQVIKERREARLRGEPVPSRYEVKIVAMDGRERWIDLTATVIEFEGEPAILVTAFDITESKLAEEAVRQSEANYRSLVDNSPFGIYRATREGQFLAVNPALVQMLGYESEAELLRLNLDTDVYCDPAERQHYIEAHWSQDRFDGVEAKWKKKDGTSITVLLAGRPVRDPQGRAAFVEVMAEDVTEKRVLEQQLRQAQKMEAVGRLAGGIAHDFNNLLTVIGGHCEMLRKRLGPDHRLDRNAAEVQKAAERAAALTQQLLTFSRKQVVQPAVLDLNEVLAGMESMLRRLIGEQIELITTPAPGLGHVKADRGQIEQVILNLALNARDAMPKGGKLIIETSDEDLDEVYARHHPGARPGSYIMLAVSDSGVGMDKDTQARIFEPFFTTKETGRGTGLGLATVYGIVKQSEGYIWAYSEPGQGSTFKVYLPRVEEAVEETRPRVPVAASTRGTETILVVEDEEPLRKLVREFLEANGYRALEAGSGEEGLRLAERYEGPIHLLMTDMVMPGMSGQDLAKRLTASRPQTKVLYMSGYTDDAMVHQRGFHPGRLFLQKPFTLDTLARKLRDVLQAGEPSRLS
jgi:two-component system cell cycle sensor histidine kinase/response regulator CckA